MKKVVDFRAKLETVERKQVERLKKHYKFSNDKEMFMALVKNALLNIDTRR